jgi:hypothetical protein
VTTARDIARAVVRGVIGDPDQIPRFRSTRIGARGLTALEDAITRAVEEAEVRGERRQQGFRDALYDVLIAAGVAKIGPEPTPALMVQALAELVGQRDDALRRAAHAAAQVRDFQQVFARPGPNREWLQALATAETAEVRMPDGRIWVCDEDVRAWARTTLSTVDGPGPPEAPPASVRAQ